MDYMADLERVGSRKPLGYLPRNTITELCGRSLAEVKAWASRAGLYCLDLGPDECFIGSGALYVWDDDALLGLLAANADLLIRTGWPTYSVEFIGKVAREDASHPALEELIGRAFGDSRWPNPVLTR